MNSLIPPGVSLGYLAPATQNLSGIPSSVDLGTKAPPILNSENITFPVHESGLGVQNLSTSPLDSMALSTQGPVFVSKANNTSREIRIDDVMNDLLKNGYVVKYRLYQGNTLSYLVAQTRLGDKVLIKINNPQYRATFPKMYSTGDINMDRRSSIALVPQDTKIGILECLNYDVCGAAFLCNNSICITEKNENSSEQLKFTEENFIFTNNATDLNSAKAGHSLLAYPVVNLTDVLANPVETELKTAAASAEISRLAYDRLRKYHQAAQEDLNRLQTELNSMNLLLNKSQAEFNTELGKLYRAYENLKGVNPNQLPDKAQEEYYVILRGLAQKKELQNELINSLSSGYSFLSMLQNISNELRNTLDPVINKFMESIGIVSV